MCNFVYITYITCYFMYATMMMWWKWIFTFAFREQEQQSPSWGVLCLFQFIDPVPFPLQAVLLFILHLPTSSSAVAIMSLPTQGCCLTININMGHNKLLAESVWLLGIFVLYFTVQAVWKLHFWNDCALFFTLCFIMILSVFHPLSNSQSSLVITTFIHFSSAEA